MLGGRRGGGHGEPRQVCAGVAVSGDAIVVGSWAGSLGRQDPPEFGKGGAPEAKFRPTAV